MDSRSVQYKLGGMACSFCVGSVEKSVGRMEGVQRVNVSLAHEEVLVHFDAERISESRIASTLTQMGYSIRDPNKVKAYEEQERELRAQRNRLLFATALSVVALAVMVAMWVGVRFVWFPYLVLVLAVVSVFGPGRYILAKAYQSLKRGILNQHVLLEFGAFSALIGGIVGTFSPRFPSAEFSGVAVFVSTYHILSGWSSNKVRAAASEAVRRLLELTPDTARAVMPDGSEREVPTEEVQKGDRLRVRPGESIPTDGRVIEGSSGVDESIVTGESMPVTKQPGDEAVGGSINQSGTLLIEVTNVGEGSFLERVAHHVEEARAMKPGILQLADRVLAIYVPGVLFFALLAVLVWIPGAWLVTGEPEIQRAVFSMLAVFVMGYPCALGMATPLAMIRGGSEGAKKGVLFRAGEAFQVLREVGTVVFDKTGTVTVGKPKVHSVIALNPEDGNGTADVLRRAAAVEQFSEHPLARAIVDTARQKLDSVPTGENFETTSGGGVSGQVEGQAIGVGQPEFLGLRTDGRERYEEVIDSAEHGRAGQPKATLSERLEELRNQGKTLVYVAVDDILSGIVSLSDTPKPDAAIAMRRLRGIGRTIMLMTGDSAETATSIADRLGIDEVDARVSPEDKSRRIRELQERGIRVAFVGDGINDAPALKQADVGIAIGTGTDIAIEAADLVVTGEKLRAVSDAFEISKRSYRKTIQNLALAFAFNGIGVPLAVTGIVQPFWAMIAMVASVSTVLLNSFGSLTGSQAEEPEELEYHVPNMSDRRSADRVEEAIQNLDPQLEVETFPESGFVVVRAEAADGASVQSQDIEGALRKAGFFPHRHENSPYK